MENFENNSTEQDPTRPMRERLLQLVSTNLGADEFFVEKFRKGVFFVPSETVNHVTQLIDEISDEDEKKQAQRLMGEILNKA